MTDREILEKLVNLPTEYIEKGHCFRCGFPMDSDKRKDMVDQALEQLQTYYREKIKRVGIENVLKGFITHILWYHDKECGRTEDVEIVFASRFKDVATAILKEIDKAFNADKADMKIVGAKNYGGEDVEGKWEIIDTETGNTCTPRFYDTPEQAQPDLVKLQDKELR